MTAVTHIAAQHITVNDRYLRQRCGWCGDILIDYDLARTAVPVGTDPTPATWPVGALVRVDGPASWVIEGERLPDNSCALPAACTCPDIDVSTLADDPDKPPTVKGHDPNCPQHGDQVGG